MPWSPDTWGPPFWKTIHITALYIDYLYIQNPKDALMKWNKFLEGITHALPCSQCEHHFLTFQKKHIPPTSSQGPDDPQFLKWTIRAHNDVRKRNNKVTPAIHDVVNAYLDGRVYKDMGHPHDVSLSKTTSLVSCYDLEQKVLGWKVGFGVVCFVMIILIIVGLIAVCKTNKHKTRQGQK